jgi:flagellar basal-body rod modification protein FlgD
MGTAPISNMLNTQTATTATATTATRNDASSQLGTNAFMKLLVSELKNQDPLNPMESRDMIVQLAQLTSVEKLNAIDTSLGSLNTGISAVSNNQTAGLIGKRITADSSHIRLNEAGSGSTRFSLSAAATGVEIAIRDTSGNLIRTLKLGDTTAGSHSVEWDGLDTSGARVPTGSYQATVSAKNASGKSIGCSQEISGLVNQIVYDNGTAQLMVNDSRVSLSDVLSISQ